MLSLTAIAVNGMVGSGIFVLPAQVAQLLGPAGLSAYLAAGLAAGLIVLCFAEVGALFDRSGGPYLYARAAFGDFVGFEIGWMMLLARLTAMAAISNATQANTATSTAFSRGWAALAESHCSIDRTVETGNSGSNSRTLCRTAGSAWSGSPAVRTTMSIVGHSRAQAE